MAQPFHKAKYQLTLLMVLLIALSWVGTLDEYSDNYIHNSIIQAGASYAIARGINGIVSSLQTSTVQVGVGVSGSIAIGEVLDPINDLIERFSDVMAWALGSLALQKILLSISAHDVFKLLITFSGLMLVGAIFLRNRGAASLASRIFLLLLFVRFSLVLVVSLNSIADHYFLSKQISNGDEELSEFRANMIQLKNSTEDSQIDRDAYEKSIAEDEARIAEIERTILPNIKSQLTDANDELKIANSNLEEIHKQRSLADNLNPFIDDPATDEAKQKVSALEQKIEMLEKDMDHQESTVKQLLEEIDVSKKRLAGEPVGLWENIKYWTPSISKIKQSLSLAIVEENLTGAVDNVIHLSVLFILKSILIPLIFLFLFIKGVKGIWNADLTANFTVDEKLARE